MKKIAKRFISNSILGFIDYYRFPERRIAWGGPLNGQQVRQSIVRSIIEETKPTAIIETGTYLGTTTEWFAIFETSVYTIEGRKRNYGFAKARLINFSNVKVILSDSREGLVTILEKYISNNLNDNLFFYLDAHWNEDLPVAEEITIIFDRCPSAIVMIDDFQVPDDPGYCYDDYGNGKSLTLDYLHSSIIQYDLSVYFPSQPSTNETSAKRGSVVICKKSSHLNKVLPSITSLRQF